MRGHQQQQHRRPAGLFTPLFLAALLALACPPAHAGSPFSSLVERLSGQGSSSRHASTKQQQTSLLPFPLLALRGGGRGGGVPLAPPPNFLQRLQQQAGEGLDKLDLPALQAQVQGYVRRRDRD